MKILVIDLERRQRSYLEDESLRREAIGGVGLTTTLLYRHTSRTIDALDPRNHLYLAAGAFAGTNVPTGSRCEASAISPLSGYFGTASSGGMLGAAIRFCGIDGIWISGRADAPVYLSVDENSVRVHDARDLWGLDTYEALDVLRQREGQAAECAVIGPAGERMVRFASIQNGYHHSFGRTGLGAVMGSKNIKAISFRGSATMPVIDRRRYRTVLKKMLERILSSPTFGYTRRYGSMVVCDVYDRLGMLPSRNFREGSVPGWESTRGRRVFEQRYKVRDVACCACPIGCMAWSRVKDGPHAGLETKGLEVTYAFEFGAKLGLADMADIFMAGEVTNRLGMDVISAASVVAYLIDLVEQGFVTEKELGFRPAYGDFSSIRRTLGLIASREGIGDVLGEGLKRAKRRFVGSEEFAPEIKGVEMPVRDPRGRFDSWVLGYLTNPRGGDHLRLRTPTDGLKEAGRDYEYEPLTLGPQEIEKLDIPHNLKKRIFGQPPSRIHIPTMAKYAEELMLLLNSVGMCIREPVLRTIGPSLMAEALRAIYGTVLDENALLATAERLFNLEHLFNLERGMTVEEFRFPERFYRESVKFTGGERPSLDRDEIERLLQRYFNLRGWDARAQVREETLKRLGIEPWKN